MADIIYIGEFTDDAGNDCAVNIHKVGFDGAAETLVMGSNPVIIKTIGDNESKFQHIVPTEAYIEVISSGFLQYVDLFTATQKTYYITILRGLETIWTGWVNPEYYTEPFITYPHTVTIHAVDGIAELKNATFPVPAVVDYNFKNSATYYIIKCLTKIALISPNRNIHVALNLTAMKYDDTLISSQILDEIYFDFRAFQDEDGEMFSYYDVLNEIMKALNARIYQDDFHWHVVRVDQKTEDYRVEYYSIGLGYYIGTDTDNVVTELTSNVGWGKTLRFENAASLEIQPTAKKFTIAQEYNNRINLLPSSSYTLFKADDFDNSGELKYFTEYVGALDYVKDETIENCLRIKSIYTGLLNALEITTTVQNEGVDNIQALFDAWKAGRVSLVLTYEVSKRFVNKDSSKTFNASLSLHASFSGVFYRIKDRATEKITLLGQKTGKKVGLTVKTTNSGGEGIWQPAANLDNITIDLAEKDDFVTVNYVINAPPDAELSRAQSYMVFWIHMIPAITNLTVGQVDTNDGLLYKNLRLYFQENFTETYDREIVTTIDEDNILEPETYEVKFGNTPDTANCNSWGVLHKSVIFDEDGKVLRKWGYYPDTLPTSDLTEFILMNDLFTTYRRPQFILNGTLLNTTLADGSGKGMMLNKILKDYDNRYYMPLSINYNMRSLEIESKWLCIRDDGVGGEFNDDFNNDFFI